MTSRLLVVLAVALLALATAPMTLAYERSPALEPVASIFAMHPAEVRCSEQAEWDDFALRWLGERHSELLFGVTHIYEDWMMFRPDLCPAAVRVADETVDPSLRALAVLTLVHEAYHSRHWPWRAHEGRVHCQAIRHFKVAARLLGASVDQAEHLYTHARYHYYGVAQPGSGYAW